jgi:hypothetical protein
MKSPRIAILLVIMAVGAIMALQHAVQAQASNLRIVSPRNGESLTTSFVSVRYHLLNPGAAGAPTPTFQLQLDSSDPVRTASTEHTFTGLAAGPHTILIQLVDANNTPIAGSTGTVRFTVAPPPPARPVKPGSAPGTANPRVLKAGLNLLAQEDNAALPAGSSNLPLLSVIGFGVLIGGIISALKTR